MHRDAEPAHVDIRTLRRYAAGLSERGIAPATIARRLAALRGLFRIQMELGAREDNPAELLSSPKKPQRLPRVLKAGEVAALLESIPATTPLELRDRALFELAYACGLRAEELVSLDLDVARLRRGDRSASRGRAARPGWSRSASTRSARSSAISARGRPALMADGEAATTARCSSRSRAAGCRPPTCGGA